MSMQYLYPIKHQEDIINYSLTYSLDPALIAAIINVESGYNEQVSSEKGAVGLMQILQPTGDWIAQKLDKKEGEYPLTDPQINIQFGCYYFRYLLNKFENADLAICAYNAGEGNVLKWLKNEDYTKDGKTLMKIPFAETKNYLAKIKNQQAIYARNGEYSKHNTQHAVFIRFPCYQLI